MKIIVITPDFREEFLDLENGRVLDTGTGTIHIFEDDRLLAAFNKWDMYRIYSDEEEDEQNKGYDVYPNIPNIPQPWKPWEYPINPHRPYITWSENSTKWENHPRLFEE